MAAERAAATITPPTQNAVYRYPVGTTHATHAVPEAWKDCYVTLTAGLQDVYVLFAPVDAASELAVDRSASPSNGTASTYGKPLDSDKTDGYPYYIPNNLTFFSVESAATAELRVEVSSPKMQTGTTGRSPVAGA